MSENLLRMPRKKRAKPKPQFMVHLDDEDRRMLDEASSLEKLPRADIIRRALRAYYRRLQKIAS